MLDHAFQRSDNTPISHRWTDQSSHSNKRHGIDTDYHTQITDDFLHLFYPKTCCGSKLTLTDGTRNNVLRCDKCHKQQTRLSGTPLHHLKLPRWMFGYLLRESIQTYPRAITAPEIQRKLAISYKAAFLLKKRLQLVAHQIVPLMQNRFFNQTREQFADFNFPHDETSDLSEMIRGKAIPQTDTVVLYSAGNRANKGRKRFKRKGQTSSIYMSESLGGHQVGTLVQTLGVKNGPVFFDSISDQKATTLIPLIRKYIPLHTPLFSDAGYKFYPGKNHRMVNHSLTSKDKRYRYSKNRWSYLGINSNTAEGNQAKLKKAFSAYGWVNPKYSQLYLDEYTFLGNLRYFSVGDLVGGASGECAVASGGVKPTLAYVDSPILLRGLGSEMILKRHIQRHPKVSRQIAACTFKAKTLIEIQREANEDEQNRLNLQWSQEHDSNIRRKLQLEYQRYREWLRSKPTKDQRRSQRYFENLAQKLWLVIPTDGFIEIRELANEVGLSTRLLFRVLSVWADRGLIEMVNRNRPTKSKAAYVYDIRRKGSVLTQMLYTTAKLDQPNLFQRFRKVTKTEVKWKTNGK